MATYNLGSYTCPANVTQNVVVGDTVTIRVFSNPNVNDPSHSTSSTNCSISGSGFSGATYTINNFSGSSYSATITDDDNFSVTVSGSVSQGDVGTISINSVLEGQSFTVTVNASSIATSTWHYDIDRLTGTSEPEGINPSWLAFTPSIGTQTFSVATGQNTESEMQFQGEQFIIYLKTGGTLGAGTVIAQQNVFRLYDDDNPITAFNNPINVPSTATSHTQYITFGNFNTLNHPDAVGVPFRIYRASTFSNVFTGTAFDNNGTATCVVNDVPAVGSSDTYTIYVDNGITEYAFGTYVVNRAAPSLVAPVISSVTDNNAASSSVTTTVNLSSTGSGGTLQYIKTNSSATPAYNDSGWQTSNIFTQARDTNFFYWAQQVSGTNRAISSSVAKYVGFLAPDTTIDNIPDQTISSTSTSFTINISGGGSTTEYQVRDSVTTHESRIGNGTITVTDAPAAGGVKTYTVYARLPAAAGGNNTYTATNEFCNITRGATGGGATEESEIGGTNETGDTRVVLGKGIVGSTEKFGLWVSKQGVPVINETSGVIAAEEDLIFDSTKAEGGMILASGSVSLPYSSLPAVSSWISFPSTYSFEPVVLVSRDAGSNAFRPMPESEYQSSASGSKSAFYFRFTLSFRVFVEVQKSRFRIHVDTSAGNNMSARPTNFSSPLSFRYLVLNIGGATSS